jgi:hypothetical protein
LGRRSLARVSNSKRLIGPRVVLIKPPYISE